MQYYRIDPELFGLKWAYGTPYADSGNYDYTKPRKVCPLCGTRVDGFNWLEPHNIKLSNKSVFKYIIAI